MARSLVAALVLVACVVGVSRAARAERWSYLSEGVELSWQVARGPRPSLTVGGRALATLTALRERRPVAWTPPVAIESAWEVGRTPLGAPDDKDVRTPITLAPHERVLWLRARASFTVGGELPRVRVLHLRARYRDSLVVTVNGRELARRHVGEAQTAQRVRGIEWEDLFLAVPPGLLARGANTLELELRPHRTRAIPALALSLAGAEGARVVRGPIVQRVTATSATIVFETDVATESAVDATAGGRPRTVSSPHGTRHVVLLDDLPAGGRVTYQVRTPAVTLPAAAFHTAPSAREPLRLAIYGDVRSGHAAHARLVTAMLASAPDAVLTTGDMVMRGSDEADWQRFFAVTATMLAQVPVYPAIGNHDLAGEGTRHLEDIFALPPMPAGRPAGGAWWSWDVAGVHVVALDSNRYDDAEQLVWLEADLAAARRRGVRAIIALTHDGPWSRGLHGGSQLARERYVPVLVRHGVTLLVSGHDHLYQRGRQDGLNYVVSGGGGAPLYKVRCGGRGKPACKVADGMIFVTSEHHWLDVEVREHELQMCPRRADGTLLEKCVTLRLK